MARIATTLNQQGTMEMRDEVLSTVGAQDMDTSGYQVSDLEDIDFHWEAPELNLDPLFRPSIDTPFSISTAIDFEMDSLAENPNASEEVKRREISIPPLSTTPVSELPTCLSVLNRSSPCGTRIENFPEYVFRKLFEKSLFKLLCMCFDRNYFQHVSFYQICFFNFLSHICETKKFWYRYPYFC